MKKTPLAAALVVTSALSLIGSEAHAQTVRRFCDAGGSCFVCSRGQPTCEIAYARSRATTPPIPPAGSGGFVGKPTGNDPTAGKPPTSGGIKNAWEEESDPRGRHGWFAETGRPGNAGAGTQVADAPQRLLDPGKGTDPAFNKFVTDTFDSSPAAYKSGVGKVTIHTFPTVGSFRRAPGGDPKSCGPNPS